eukprot:356365-Chlamydomonas_euryale.AAC.8
MVARITHTSPALCQTWFKGQSLCTVDVYGLGRHHMLAAGHRPPLQRCRGIRLSSDSPATCRSRQAAKLISQVSAAAASCFTSPLTC